MQIRIIKLNLTFILLVLLFSCSTPYDNIKNRTWLGSLIRVSDDKELSTVAFKMSHDTMYVFSNAIFGAENDTLLIKNFEKKDSTFTFRSLNGSIFSLKLGYLRDGENEHVYFVGDGYYFGGAEISSGIKAPEVLDFYQNRNVPRDAYMYLDGTYEGRLETNNQYSDIFLGIGGASLKMVFLDNFQVKIFFNSLFADMFISSSNPNYEIVNYAIEDNSLILEKPCLNIQKIDVNDYGEKLVCDTKNYTVVMHKKY